MIYQYLKTRYQKKHNQKILIPNWDEFAWTNENSDIKMIWGNSAWMVLKPNESESMSIEW